MRSSPSADISSSEADAYKVDVSALVAQVLFTKVNDKALKSIAKKMKKKSKYKDTDIPPPWLGLDQVCEEQREAFWDAEWKEIEGILESSAAIPITIDEVPEGEKIVDSLTLRSEKKNGPNKGKKKVRVVEHGGQHEEGTHYEQSHAPTIQIVSLRGLIAAAAALDGKILPSGEKVKTKMRGGDFPQAYLNADKDIVTYMWPPKSAPQYTKDGKRIVWKVPKALYGGKPSGRYWYNHLKSKLATYGFHPTEWDPCVFKRVRADGHFYFLGVYVDDTIHVYTDDAEFEELDANLKRDFLGYTDLGPLTEIFNAEVIETDTHVTLSQTRYIEDLTKRFLNGETAKVHTPAESEGPNDLNKLVREAVELAGEVDPVLRSRYRALVGALLTWRWSLVRMWPAPSASCRGLSRSRLRR